MKIGNEAERIFLATKNPRGYEQHILNGCKFLDRNYKLCLTVTFTFSAL